MAIRAGMTNLVTRTQRLINDVSEATWTEEQVQEYLDQNRMRANQMALQAEPTRGPSATTYTTFYAPYGNWEESVTLVDSGYNSVTADSLDYANGIFAFNSSQDNRPIMITGWYYDLYGAAADILEEKLSSNSDNYDFGADGGSYKRSQIGDKVKETVAHYRSLQWSRTVSLVRSDVNIYQF